MSWDESVETKTIEGIGIAKIITRTDDWDRLERSVSLDSDSYHIERKYVGRHPLTTVAFYAVPNGKTINHSLDLPEIKEQSFQEELCYKYPKKSLIEFLRLLNGKRAKFEYPMKRRNKLKSIATDYYNRYKKIDRLDCSKKVQEAIEIFDNYQYNYLKFYELKEEAQRIKYKLDSKVLEMSTAIY
ncbi:hypothetical protein ACR6LN_002543 [Enterococcus hirae]|nr:hypothetical protein [Enterococcus hirae]